MQKTNTPMKSCIASTLLLVILGCTPRDKTPDTSVNYEFHSNGLTLWRCNRKTGEAYFCRVNELQWQRVLEPGERSAPKKDIFDEVAPGK
jgi:hypothetical protein